MAGGPRDYDEETGASFSRLLNPFTSDYEETGASFSGLLDPWPVLVGGVCIDRGGARDLDWYGHTWRD